MLDRSNFKKAYRSFTPRNLPFFHCRHSKRMSETIVPSMNAWPPPCSSLVARVSMSAQEKFRSSTRFLTSSSDTKLLSCWRVLSCPITPISLPFRSAEYSSFPLPSSKTVRSPLMKRGRPDIRRRRIKGCPLWVPE